MNLILVMALKEQNELFKSLDNITTIIVFKKSLKLEN